MYQELTTRQYNRAMNLGPLMKDKRGLHGRDALSDTEKKILDTYLRLMGKPNPDLEIA